MIRNPPAAGLWHRPSSLTRLAAERGLAIEWVEDPAEPLFRGLVSGLALSAMFWTGAALPILF